MTGKAKRYDMLSFARLFVAVVWCVCNFVDYFIEHINYGPIIKS